MPAEPFLLPHTSAHIGVRAEPPPSNRESWRLGTMAQIRVPSGWAVSCLDSIDLLVAFK